MNQQILFNDDIYIDYRKQVCTFSGLLGGERISINVIMKEQVELNDDLRFNIENLVEEWLEENEPPLDGKIELLYK